MIPVGSNPRTLHGSSKVHKPFSGSYPYLKTVKNSRSHFVCYKQNEFTDEYSFSFVSEILVQDSNLDMSLLDVDFLFTSIVLVTWSN